MALCLNKTVEAQLRALPGNNVCCDCNDKHPQWASVSFGVFMCLECSGRHRALGVHISFVRSVSMDSWNEKQIKQMKAGGNDKCNEFLKGHSIHKTMAIPQKYNSPAAELYRDRLLAEVEGKPLPTELKAPTSNVVQGSDPLPGESEVDYVARQRKLQEEARERMRQKFGTSSGLSSGGKMTAMGSDSSYRPGQNNSTSGMQIDISEVSKNAFSFIQDSAKLIGDNVAKLADKPAGGGTGTAPAGNEGGWGAFAGSIWEQAAAATSDLVKHATESEDIRFPRPDDGGGNRFPRPPDAPSSSTTGSSKYAGFGSSNADSSSSSNSQGGNGGTRNSKDNSWDDLGDFLNAGMDKKKDPAGNNGGHVRADSGGSGYVSSVSAHSDKGGLSSTNSSEPSLSSLNKLSISDPSEVRVTSRSDPSESPMKDGIASTSRYASNGSLATGESSGSSRKKTTKLKIEDGEDNWDEW